jgi:hypothetical protein
MNRVLNTIVQDFTFSHSALAIAWSPHSSTASEGLTNTSLPPLNTCSIPTSADGTGRPPERVCKRVHFPPLQYPFRLLMGPTHRWRVDIFVDIGSNGRIHIAPDNPDGPPDCAETVASNGYSFKKDRTSPMMCWASDSLICAAMKVVLMRTCCKRLSMSKKEHVHDGRVIVQRGGARSGSRRWKG